ncbi:hypothetical protein FB556_0974 [Enteractinococcus coprophilus]|uniref:Intracellular proteinase inhibitor BsuPI n=1 Tax=Enteractinococcus coprophilus TaxID=1027633 RepID=A0A543APM1_9MICC|nr:hypothetical protein FB556_0974 [Enteractinococcus coprophilus]
MAVIILLIILALIGWGIWALIGLFLPDDDDQSSPQPQPTVTETVSPSPEASEEEDNDDEPSADACAPEMLVVTGATDQESYAPDETPEFTLTVTHDGDVLCDASLGSDQQNFVVEDADGGFVFSTRACQVDPQEQIVEMEPGQSEEVIFEWERVGTDEQCETIIDDVEPGEYQLVVAMGEHEAEPVRFELAED